MSKEIRKGDPRKEGEENHFDTNGGRALEAWIKSPGEGET